MRGHGLVQDQKAAVYVEFLVVFMPVFVLFLGMIQLCLMFGAKLVVQHSADAACRSAIVVIPDDPAFYDGKEETPTGQINFATVGEAGGIVNDILDIIETLTGTTGSLPRRIATKGDKRLNTIRMAAFKPLLAVAPTFDQAVDAHGSDSVESALGDNGLSRAASGLFYNLMAVGVTFPSGPRADDPTTSGTQSFAADANITTRVTYMFHCAVPFAAQIMCDPILRLGAQNAKGVQELEAAPAPVTRLPAALLRGYYRILRAEATMLNQGAPYQYRVETGRTMSSTMTAGSGTTM